MVVKLSEGNPVSGALPQRLDSFLQDLAQMTSTFSYSDIIKKKSYSSEEIKELRKYYRQFCDLDPFGSDDSELLSIGAKVSKILKGGLNEDFDISDTERMNLTDESQAKILDALTYLASTEYEAISQYVESAEKIKSAGFDSEITQQILEEIEAIRKDEEDHAIILEGLIDKAKSLTTSRIS